MPEKLFGIKLSNGMKTLKKCIKVGLVGGVLGGLLVALILGEKVLGKAKVVETSFADLNLEEVQRLKAYHGAKVVSLKNGRWYFLGPRGRKWYPLTTYMACQDLGLSCMQTASK